MGNTPRQPRPPASFRTRTRSTETATRAPVPGRWLGRRPSPLRGSNEMGAPPGPRALPWASILCPFGATPRVPRCSPPPPCSPEGPTIGAPAGPFLPGRMPSVAASRPPHSPEGAKQVSPGQRPGSRGNAAGSEVQPSPPMQPRRGEGSPPGATPREKPSAGRGNAPNSRAKLPNQS